MRLHTDGNTIVLLTPLSRLTWQKSGKTSAQELPENPDVSDYDRSGLMCLTPSGERDFSARLLAAGAIAADAIDEDNVAAILLGDDTTYLVRGPVQVDSEWSDVVDIGQVEATRIEWPAGLVWKKGDTSLYDMAEAHGSGIPPAFVPTIENNEHGTAIASVGSGVIVVVRPGSTEPNFAVQIPSQEEAAIYACATPEGVLVSLIVDGQDAAYIHIAENGSVLGHRSTERSTPAIKLDQGYLIYDDGKIGLQHVDTSLKTIAEITLPFSAIDSAVASDGTSFALADADSILRGHLNAQGQLVILATTSYDPNSGRKSEGELAAADAKWDPARSHGKTAVGFAAKIKQDPWAAQSGSDFSLEMFARSIGGSGHGISVVLGGDAIKHCEFSSIEVGGIKVEFAKDSKGQYTAELPEVELVLGLDYPFNPKPKNDAQKHASDILLGETHLKLTLHGKALKTSGELMSVSISAIKSDCPPLKWMRPFTIS